MVALVVGEADLVAAARVAAGKNCSKLDSERSECRTTSPPYLAATSLETFCFY